MTNTKKKQGDTEKKGKVLAFNPGPYAKHPTERGAESHASELEIWRSTVEELQQQHFMSTEAAIEAVVDRVLQKLNALGDDEEMRSFLYQLLSLDSQIVSDLEKSLRIGS